MHVKTYIGARLTFGERLAGKPASRFYERGLSTRGTAFHFLHRRWPPGEVHRRRTGGLTGRSGATARSRVCDDGGRSRSSITAALLEEGPTAGIGLASTQCLYAPPRIVRAAHREFPGACHLGTPGRESNPDVPSAAGPLQSFRPKETGGGHPREKGGELV